MRTKRTRETKVRKHVSPGCWLLAAAAAASGGAFKRTLANRCILDGCDFSAGVVVQRVKKDRTSIVRRKSRVFRLITCEYYQVKADVPPCGPSAFR